MSSTVFTNNVTLTDADWFNDLNRLHYAILGDPADAAAVKTALGLGNAVVGRWVVAGGTADAITATYSPAITSLVDGQLCFFRASAANATTTPSFSPNGLTARTITLEGGAALRAGEIPAALAEVILRYNLANTRWELLNPSFARRGANADITSLNAPALGAATATTQSPGDNTTKVATTAFVTTLPTFATTIGVGNTAASASGAGVSFPATQSASTNANTLDDYEEGDFTPTLVFTTNGNINIVYSTQVGRYTKIGRLVNGSVDIVTSTFTHTTASGTLFFQGSPFAMANVTGLAGAGACSLRGYTKANFTAIALVCIPSSGSMSFMASGSAQAATNLTTADMPTGGTVEVHGSFNYIV